MQKKSLYAVGLCTLVLCIAFLLWPSTEKPTRESAEPTLTDADSATLSTAEIRTVKLS
ncbi:hypothetical protein RMSM_05395, partial [Rhodopirellula maiorica SM1]